MMGKVLKTKRNRSPQGISSIDIFSEGDELDWAIVERQRSSTE
jgi:hypothetical protein